MSRHAPSPSSSSASFHTLPSPSHFIFPASPTSVTPGAILLTLGEDIRTANERLNFLDPELKAAANRIEILETLSHGNAERIQAISQEITLHIKSFNALIASEHQRQSSQEAKSGNIPRRTRSPSNFAPHLPKSQSSGGGVRAEPNLTPPSSLSERQSHPKSESDAYEAAHAFPRHEEEVVPLPQQQQETPPPLPPKRRVQTPKPNGGATVKPTSSAGVRRRPHLPSSRRKSSTLSEPQFNLTPSPRSATSSRRGGGATPTVIGPSILIEFDSDIRKVNERLNFIDPELKSACNRIEILETLSHGNSERLASLLELLSLAQSRLKKHMSGEFTSSTTEYYQICFEEGEEAKERVKMQSNNSMSESSSTEDLYLFSE